MKGAAFGGTGTARKMASARKAGKKSRIGMWLAIPFGAALVIGKIIYSNS